MSAPRVAQVSRPAPDVHVRLPGAPAAPRAGATGAALGALRRLGKAILALLRELADETAYQRHLAAHGRAHSGGEWRRFCEERLRAKYTRPKCC